MESSYCRWFFLLVNIWILIVNFIFLVRRIHSFNLLITFSWIREIIVDSDMKIIYNSRARYNKKYHYTVIILIIGLKIIRVVSDIVLANRM